MTRRILFGTLLVAVSSAPIRAADDRARPGGVVSRDTANLLRVIAAGWADNFLRVQSLKARATLRIEDARYEACKDAQGKTYRDQTVQLTMWKGKGASRLDLVYDRTFDVAQGRVNYSPPRDERIRLAGDDDDDQATYRKDGSTQVTHRVLRNHEATYTYYVEHRALDITHTRSPGPSAPAEALWLMHDALILGTTLEEHIRRTLSGRGKTTVKRLHSGAYVMIHSIQYGPPGKQSTGRLEVTVDPDKGFTVQGMRGFTNGKLDYMGRFTYAELADAWVLISGEGQFFETETGSPRKTTFFKVEEPSLEVNKAVDGQMLTPAGLSIERGVLVRDARTGERYYFDDIPIDLKVALAMAEQHLEKLPDELTELSEPQPTPGALLPARSVPKPTRQPARSDQPKQLNILAVAAAASCAIVIVICVVLIRARKGKVW